MTPNLPIRTERLSLRAFTLDDFDAFHAYHRLPEVSRYLCRGPRTVEQSYEALERAASLRFHDDGDYLVLAVERSADTRLLGEVMLKLTSRASRQAELGYVFAPSAAGHGYAMEAARALLAVGFEECELHRIFARLDEENVASAKLARRLGMRQEARLVEAHRCGERWVNEVIFAILDSEWR